jgi:hypothetical protein
MASDDTASAHLRLDFGSTPSVRRFVTALAAVEYLFNVIAYPIWYSSRYVDTIRNFELLIHARQCTSMSDANFQLGLMLPARLRLGVRSIEMRSPANTTLGGLADAIQTLVDILNPLAWAERWEDLRHKRVFNRELERQMFAESRVKRSEAQVREYEAIVKALDTVERLAHVREEFSNTIGDRHGWQNVNVRTLDELLVFELARGIRALEEVEAIVIADRDSVRKDGLSLGDIPDIA